MMQQISTADAKITGFWRLTSARVAWEVVFDLASHVK